MVQKQASDERFPIMAMLANPDDFVSWPHAQKIEFYERAVAWHDYIDSHMNDRVSQAWGTQTFPGMAVNPGKILLIALYQASFDEFSQWILEDPLWNLAIYQAPALMPVVETAKNDFEDDWQGHLRLRK